MLIKTAGNWIKENKKGCLITAVALVVFALLFVLIFRPFQVIGISQDIASAFNSDDVEKISHLKSEITLEVNAKQLSYEKAEEAITSASVQQACKDFFLRNLESGDYSKINSLLYNLNLGNSLFNSLNEIADTTIREYIDEAAKGKTFDEVLSLYHEMQEELSNNRENILVPQALIEDNLLKKGTELYEGMPGYYSDPANQEEDDTTNEVATYKEGWESALRTLNAGTKWSYFGDYALKISKTARDNLSGGFTYRNDVELYCRGEIIDGITSVEETLDGIIVYDDFYYVPEGKLYKKESSDRASLWVETDAIDR